MRMKIILRSSLRFESMGSKSQSSSAHIHNERVGIRLPMVIDACERWQSWADQ